VVVYAATPAGIAAAVVAAESGMRVLLLEPTGHIGGMNTNGLNTAETEHMLDSSLGGFALRFYQRMGEVYGLDGPEFHFESSVAEKVFEEFLQAASVEVRLNTRLSGVVKDGSKIQAVCVSGPHGDCEISGHVFIDASYEGDLLACSGVSWTIGRESTEEFGEDAAGARFDGSSHTAPTRDRSGRLLPGISCTMDDVREGAGDSEVMCYNLRPTLARDQAWRIPMPAPSSYDPLRFEIAAGWILAMVRSGWTPAVGDLIDLYTRRNQKLEANNCQAAVFSLGLPGFQSGWCTASFTEREDIFRQHVDHVLGYFYFLTHDDRLPESLRAEARDLGLHAGEFIDSDHLPRQLYVREGRRMRGRAVVTQHDVTRDRSKEDSIGVSSHFLDCHHVRRVELRPGCFANEGRIWRRGQAYQIPYRALTPLASECVNLLVPVAASFSHVAYASFRLESIWMVAGHAAGAAAALAVSLGSGVVDVPVHTLQESLRAGGQVVDLSDLHSQEFQGGDGGWIET
jgi:hypothetical protein